MKRLMAVVAALALSACSTLGVDTKGAAAYCVTGAGWNGAPATVLALGADNKSVQTGGGSVTMNCGGASATFTDAGKVVMPKTLLPAPANR